MVCVLVAVKKRLSETEQGVLCAFGKMPNGNESEEKICHRYRNRIQLATATRATEICITAVRHKGYVQDVESIRRFQERQNVQNVGLNIIAICENLNTETVHYHLNSKGTELTVLLVVSLLKSAEINFANAVMITV